MGSGYEQWQKGNLKLEGENWFIVQWRKFYVLTFKSRHCNVNYKFMRYFITSLVILIFIGLFFGLHFFVFFPE